MTAQALIDQWRLHPSPEVGSCANQLAGWLRESGWQPMETAPEATWVLVFVPNYGMNIATMTRDPNIIGPNGAYWFIRGDDDPCCPTLWTHLPPLPAASRGGGDTRPPRQDEKQP